MRQAVLGIGYSQSEHLVLEANCGRLGVALDYAADIRQAIQKLMYENYI